MSANKSIFALAKSMHKPTSLKNIFLMAKFASLAHKYRAEIEDMYARLDALDIPVTTEMLGVVEWPYIHNEWDVRTRLDKIATHYEIVSKLHPGLTQMNASPCRKIDNFDAISKGVYIGVDYAKWFTREGELVINIFRDELRVASMAFTLGLHEGEIVAYIGAVQGIHGGIPADESLAIFKTLTKDFDGLRPRSLLLEVLKVVVNQLGAKKLLGVSEQNRHHRHIYFGNDQSTEFKNDYNPFWEEHGGEFISDTGFYEISLVPAIRDLSDIAAKKRGQYRRRNELIAGLANSLNLGQ